MDLANSAFMPVHIIYVIYGMYAISFFYDLALRILILVRKGIVKYINFTFQCILLSLGWMPHTQHLLEELKSAKSFVGIFPHTSYWDFVICILYYFAYSSELPDIYLVSRPQDFKYFGPLLRFCHMIPATSKEESGKGFISNTVKEFRAKKTQYIIMISPEGTRSASPWKSGYFYLAKELNIPIRVVGPDYEYKEVVLLPERFADRLGKREDIEPELMTDMHSIVPLYPNSSFLYVRHHKSEYLYPVDPIIITNVLTGFVCNYYLFMREEYLVCMCGIVSTFVSLLYHWSHETVYLLQKLDTFFVLVGLSFYITFLAKNNLLFLDYVNSLLLILTFWFYIIGHGRKCHEKRPRHYIIYHSLFHLFAGLSLLYPLL